jgi:uncharacterized pyridoxal phosphate-containing UPF0001 family protein
VDGLEADALSAYIIEECHGLEFRGLMTIGEYGREESSEPNPDFVVIILKLSVSHVHMFQYQYVLTSSPQ